ncbi:hypothetical protein Cma02nite_16480 [Cellulomonas marina]|uniref:Glucose / Sorbosone dehydrogenase n=1 Tax=Cellulomonas marina TaxID=988821 RepID=A0A1I0Z8B7_9CELL|nr:hypothetical protein Cma02nite_16480 [Cellulomonas marina]SFB21652.1 Glucose / Sorbosone dehydrogenase [Cellulomonas marina]
MLLLAALAALLPVAVPGPTGGAPVGTAAAATVPAGYVEQVAFRGLVQPTVVRFAPDGRVFVAEKRGTVVMFDGPGDTTPTRVADLRTEVHNFWDRGLLGLAVDPAFPTRPYLYVTYTFDGPVGGTAPRWGTPGADSDPCPSPPGATADGCVVSGKLARLTLSGTTTTRTDLVHDWCQQYPSHSMGDVTIGRDGALYVSGGDGASFTFTDYGQDGSPTNPCGDPGGATGAVLAPPTAEGGSLRAQDVRTTADPTGLSGSVVRVSPDTGLAMPDNPGRAATDANARRIVAHGLRNPLRSVVRPGTDELWIADVGANTWEEVNRVVAPKAAVTNLGWPCYEGDARQPRFDAADLRLCEGLYTQPDADTTPYLRYQHGVRLSAADTCDAAGGSSISGLAFASSTGPYPDALDGALFVSDYSRACIWVVPRGADGLPDRTQVRPFVTAAAGPVQLEVSPAGVLHYVDLVGGTIRRVVPDPSTTGCPASSFRAEYFANRTLTGVPAVTACEAAPLRHDWAYGAPAGLPTDGFSGRWTGTVDVPTAGSYRFTATADDGVRVRVDGVVVVDRWVTQSATTVTGTRALTAGPHQVQVEWFDATGKASLAVGWAPVDAPPVPTVTTPSATSTWQVGQTVTFSGGARDPEQGALPASALRWELVLQHCPDACHAHPVQSWTGTASGSFVAPDHEYPAHLELRLTATDAAGNAATTVRRLEPRTTALTVTTQPPGLQVTVGERTGPSPLTTTVLLGGTTSVTTPSPQTLAGLGRTFTSWSDGGARTHGVVATAATQTLTATFAPAAACPAGQYRAEYFANRSLSGAPVSVSCEAAPLAHDWGAGSPPGVGPDEFSARWAGTFGVATAGTYRFTVTADDGVRLWVDDVLLLDRWYTHAVQTFTASRTLTAGSHRVRVEWFDGTRNAVAQVSWALR